MPTKIPSLDPMLKALSKLPFKADPKRTVIVAGTNGKGSVCATLEALLSHAGQVVGFYSSPHLVDITERFRYQQKPVTREIFCLAYERVTALIPESAQLTHFEMLTLMAVWVFTSGEALPAVDYLVLEVGMGGIWDATNAIPHGLAIITRLGLDHQKFLGPTLADIARNKLGVVTHAMPVIHGELPPEVQRLFWETAKIRQAILKQADPPTFRIEADGRYRAITPWGEAPLSLMGARAVENANLALKAFEALGFDPASHLGALAQVDWPGRFQKFGELPVYLSGDHNTQGVLSLLEILQHISRKAIHFLVGIAEDKDHGEMLRLLSQLPNATIALTETPFKPTPIERYHTEVAVVWRQAHIEKAWQRFIAEIEPGSIGVVTGSLYLVGAIMKLA